MKVGEVGNYPVIVLNFMMESNVDAALSFNSLAFKVAGDLVTDSPDNSLARRNAHEAWQGDLPTLRRR